MLRNIKTSTLILILVLAGLVIYLNCLPNEMFWDDDDFILHNRFIQDWQFWPKFFTDNLLSGTHLLSNYWRPLLQIVFAVEWHLWASWVWGWHFVSVLAHITAGVMLFKCLELVTRERTVAFLTALIFIIHPLQTEAVVYPNAMGDSLACIFIFAGLYFYGRFRQSAIVALRSGWWWLALGMFPLALLSKETGILFAGYLPLCDYMLQPERDGFRKRLVTILKTAWPFVLTAAGYLLLRATVLNINSSFNFYHENNAFTSSFMLRLLTFFRVITIDAGLLFFPYELRVERLIDPPTSFFIPDVMAGAAILLGLIILAFRCWKQRPLITFGVLWLLIGLMPTSNLFAVINAMIYEHFLYSAMIGVVLIIIWQSYRWAVTERGRTIFYVVMAIFLAFFVGRSFWRTFDWRTSVGFYEDLVRRGTHSYRVINNLGMEYAQHGQPQKAEVTYNQAIAIDPGNAVAWHNLGNLYRGEGQPERAITFFEKALALQPSFIFSYRALAQLYIDKNDLTRARNVMERYFTYCDDKLFAIQTLITLAQRQNDPAGAARYQAVLQQMH